jgi:hypothetical protein
MQKASFSTMHNILKLIAACMSIMYTRTLFSSKVSVYTLFDKDTGQKKRTFGIGSFHQDDLHCSCHHYHALSSTGRSCQLGRGAGNGR